MTDMSYAALDLASRGWPVFPCELKIGDDVVALEDVPEGAKVKKVPVGDLVEHGYKEATLNPKKIALWWRVRPDALVGIGLPKGTMVLDVDEVEKFERAGLVLPDGATFAKTLSGGYHVYFKTDGRPVRQTVKEIDGADTRVGGLGYVVAWTPDAIPDVGAIPDAPEWIYGPLEPVLGGESPRGDAPPVLNVRRVRRGAQVEVATIRVGSRDNEMARVAGSMRRQGLGPNAIYAALRAMLDDGQIESPREDPVTDKDLRRIAGSIGTRDSDAVDRQRRAPVERHFATDLINKNLRPLEYMIEEIFPEGLGVVAGAPKVGKSWLTFQSAIEIAAGGEVLGRQVPEARPVLYYGLEDGERRFQKRLHLIIGGRSLDLSLLELRYDAPRIGEGLEDDISKWLDDNEGGVVFIDVLAKVRPDAKGRGSAYDEDYGVIAPIQELSKKRPGSSIVVVTHDRKAGSDDFLTMVTGTRGITGAADWVWVIKRERLKLEGTLFITGRDIEKEPAIEAAFAGVWTLIGGVGANGASAEQKQVLDALSTEGDMTAGETADYLHGEHPDAWSDDFATRRNSASEKLNKLEEKGLVERAGHRAGRGGAVVFHRVTDAEREAQAKAIQAARAATLPTTMRVRRTRGGAPAGTRGGARRRAMSPSTSIHTSTPLDPKTPLLAEERDEHVEGVDGVDRHSRRPAYARTRGRLAARLRKPDDDGLVDIE